MRVSRMLFVSCLLGLLSGLCSTAQAAPEAGWYWNPAESGRGFFIESLATVIYMGGYLYDSDGHALWVVSGAPNSDPYNYTGRLLSYSGGQTLTGAYNPPGTPQDIGPVSIHFSDDTHATLTWPGGTIQLQREIFGTGTPAFKPLTGWWWNPDESGRGYSIEVQGNSLFFVGFMYEASGRPVWYFSAGPVGADPTTYSGPLLQFANGQTMTGPYQPPGAPTPIGKLDIAFTGENAGTLTFTRTSAAKAAGTTKDDVQVTVPIIPEFVKPGEYVTPDWFVGSFNEDVLVKVSLPGTPSGSGSAHYILKGDNVTWQKQFVDGALGGNTTQVTTYVMLGGEITLTIHMMQTARDPDVGVLTCTQDTMDTVKLGFPFTTSATLTIDSYARYDLSLDFDNSFNVSLGKAVCIGPGGGLVDFDAPDFFLTPALAVTGLFGAVTADEEELPPLGGGEPVLTGIIEDDIPAVHSILGFDPATAEYTQTGHYKFVESSECATEFCPTIPPPPGRR
jgi:hypothetical protein